MLIFFFICSSVITAFNPVSASDLVEDSWNTKASINQARSGLGTVEVNGKIYAIGGHTSSGYVGTNERYDPATNTWTILAPMPTPRTSFAIVACQDKIYCIGGIISKGDTMSAFVVNEVYDIATDNWSTKAALPFDGVAMGQAVNGKIFVISYGNALHMYDPTTDVWTTKTSKPVGGYGNILVAMDSKLLVSFDHDSSISIGAHPSGFSKQRMVKVIMIYDTETDTWSEKTTSDQIFESFFAVAGATTGLYASQKVYFVGATSTTVYDPKSDTWSTAKAMPTERKDFAVVVLDDTLYVIGGEKAHANTFLNFLLQLFRHDTLSVTEQYIPLDYSGTILATPEPFLNRTVIATVVLTIIGIVTASSLLFYFKKRKPT